MVVTCEDCRWDAKFPLRYIIERTGSSTEMSIACIEQRSCIVRVINDSTTKCGATSNKRMCYAVERH